MKNGHIDLDKFLIESGGVIEQNYTINLLLTACVFGNIDLIKASLNYHELKHVDSCFTGNSPRLLRNNFL